MSEISLYVILFILSLLTLVLEISGYFVLRYFDVDLNAIPFPLLFVVFCLSLIPIVVLLILIAISMFNLLRTRRDVDILPVTVPGYGALDMKSQGVDPSLNLEKVPADKNFNAQVAKTSKDPKQKCKSSTPIWTQTKINTRQEYEKLFNEGHQIILNNHRLLIKRLNLTISGENNQCFFYALSQLKYNNQKEYEKIRDLVLSDDLKQRYHIGRMADAAVLGESVVKNLEKNIIILSLNYRNSPVNGFFSLFYKNGGRVEEGFLNINFNPSEEDPNNQKIFYDNLINPDVYRLLLFESHFEIFEVEDLGPSN